METNWLISDYEATASRLRKEVEAYKTKNEYNLSVCRNQSELIGMQRRQIQKLEGIIDELCGLLPE